MAATNAVTFDLTKFNIKMKELHVGVDVAIKKAVDFGMSELSKAAINNLAGPMHPAKTPAPYPGKLPVSIITGQLHQRGIVTERPRDDLGIVKVNKNVPYSHYVHDGTKFMKARPFLMQAVRDKREAIIRRFDNLMTLAIRAIGQK